LDRNLLIVGASGRAAASSAVRADWRACVIDLFADDDTRALGPVLRCSLADYPHGFVALAEQAPPGPWLYTGGLENHPDVVAAISRRRQLFGVPPDVLRVVRDPFVLGTLVPTPQTQRAGEALDPTKRWLLKSLRGSGGYGVEELPLSVSERGPGGEVYAQERVDGSSYSALFLFHDRGSPSLIGVCAQLIGEPWLNAPPFRYCGNIGPLALDAEMEKHLLRTGDSLSSLGLRGLVGIDFLRTAEGLSVLEVNPRYTASVELYVAEHIGSFAGSAIEAVGAPRSVRKIHGKAILYSARDFEVPADHPWRPPVCADIPRVGSTLLTGQPVVTLFASADTESECRERLKELARERGPR